MSKYGIPLLVYVPASFNNFKTFATFNVQPTFITIISCSSSSGRIVVIVISGGSSILYFLFMSILKINKSYQFSRIEQYGGARFLCQ